MDHFLAIRQRCAHAAWPHTRCIDAVTISGKTERAWAAVRATNP
eukprot:COSAG03_NODE_12036_length_565_cov_0.555794_1_plen_43_part_01